MAPASTPVALGIAFEPCYEEQITHARIQDTAVSVRDGSGAFCRRDPDGPGAGPGLDIGSRHRRILAGWLAVAIARSGTRRTFPSGGGQHEAAAGVLLRSDRRWHLEDHRWRTELAAGV